jgi:hypothetical protein
MSIPLPSRTSKILVIAALLWLADSMAPAVAPPPDPGALLVRALRKQSEEKDTLHGALILGGRREAGMLKLAGFCDSDGQKSAIEKEAERLTADNPRWKKAFPAGVSADGLKLLPIRSKYLAILQADFARPDRTGPDAAVLRQSRFDDAFFADDPATGVKLVFRGVSLAIVDDLETRLRQGVREAVDRLDALAQLRPILAEYPLRWDFKSIALSKQPISLLQNKSAEDPEMAGVLFWNNWYDGVKVLHIEGVVRRTEQIKTAESWMKGLGADPRCFAAGLEKPWSFKEMSVDADFLKLAALQEQLAKSTAPGPRSVRLDRVYFTWPGETRLLQLNLQGIWLDPDYKEPDLRKQIFDAWPTLKARYNPTPNYDNLKPVPFNRQPIYLLQNEAARDPAMDGSLFWTSWFDSNGVLQIQGIVMSKKQLETAEKLMKDLRPDPRILRPSDGKSGWSFKEMKIEERFLEVPPLQKRIAADAQLKSIRVDRLYFSYPGETKLLQLNVKGVCIDPTYSTPEGRGRIQPLLNSRIDATYPGLKAQYHPTPNYDGLELLSQPRTTLQLLVARGGDVVDPRKHNPLDGVGIAPGAYYDEKGRLCIRGVWLGPSQEKPLRKLMPVLARFGLMRNDEDFQLKLVELRTDLVLEELREWLADPLGEAPEDARADRLYFDANGLLTLQGHHVHPRDKLAIAAKLVQIITDNPRMGGKVKVEDLASRLLSRSKPAEPKTYFVALGGKNEKPKEPKEPKVEEGPKIDSTPWPHWTQELRRMVQTPDPAEKAKAALRPDRKWDGVWLVRGSFSPEGVYTLAGLGDSARQIAQLSELLRELSESQRWQRALGKGWDLKRLRVLPLAPMLARMRIVMPAWPVFDGMTLLGASHDVKGVLVLRIRQIIAGGARAAATARSAAAAEMERQLLNDDRWKVRAAAGVRFSEVGPPVAPSGDAETLLLRSRVLLRRWLLDHSGVCCLADCPLVSQEEMRKAVGEVRGLLDAVILNAPGESSAWFLRALCYAMEGDTVQADRDLRRMVEAERHPEEGRFLRSNRLAFSEPFQGVYRKLLNDAKEKKISRDIAAGKPPITLSR